MPTTTIPPYTPCPGGYITAQTLPDGQYLIESWRLNPTPHDSPQPYTEPVHHWIGTNSTEAARLIGEFTDYLTGLTARLNAQAA